MPTSVIKSRVLTFQALLLIVHGEGTKMLCLLRIWWLPGPVQLLATLTQGLAAWQTLHWCLLFICIPHTEKRVPLGHTQEKEFSEQEAHAQLLSLSCFQTWILDYKSILIKQLDLPVEWKC